MHAELRIGHRGDDLVSRLAEIFGPDSRAVVARSPLLAQNPAWPGLVAYAVETASLRLFCFVASPYELQLMVESIPGGDLKVECDTVWTAVRRAARKHKVRLRSLRVVDEATGQTITTARTGLVSGLARKGLWPGLATGAVTALWLGISLTTFASGDVAPTVEGAIPALVLAAVSLFGLIALRGRLVWRG
jgi:hypothetical protein